MVYSLPASGPSTWLNSNFLPLIVSLDVGACTTRLDCGVGGPESVFKTLGAHEAQDHGLSVINTVPQSVKPGFWHVEY